jgi:hypothetical protein
MIANQVKRDSSSLDNYQEPEFLIRRVDNPRAATNMMVYNHLQNEKSYNDSGHILLPEYEQRILLESLEARNRHTFSKSIKDISSG